MSYEVKYPAEKAPKAGLVANAINAFSLDGKIEAEKQFHDLFNNFKTKGIINQESVLYEKRVFGPHEAQKVAELFSKARIDVLIILNSAFPNGNSFLTLANDPYLMKVPLVLVAPYEIEYDIPEWTTNAWCGVIMNNYVAKRIERKIFPLAGWPRDREFQERLKMFMNVFYTVKEIRKDFLGRFGDAPGGFHSASGNQLDYAQMFGTRVETIDWTAVMNVFKTGSAEGYLGKSVFTEEDVRKTADVMKKGRIVLVSDNVILKAARLYHSFRAIIRANGFTSSAFRCWPEMGEPYIGVAPCFSMGWLLSKHDVTAASCESDWPTAITQSIGTLLSGKPCACLDFVNYLGKGPVCQLGHCGVGIAGHMSSNELDLEGEVSGEMKEKIMSGKIRVNDAIAEKSPDRQGGQVVAPAHIGQFEYGIKTGINLVQDKNGNFKMLIFTGESSPRTAKAKLYSASDVSIKNYSKLSDLVLKHGFSHHLAVALGDITQELKILCDYYGIEYYYVD